MKYFMLASGSKGNACVIDVNGVKIMIDCGTTKRYLNQSLESIGLSFDSIDYVLVTHDHSDHTSQLKHFKHAITYSPTSHDFDSVMVNPYESFEINGVNVLPIKTSHDDESSVGYVLSNGDSKLVYVTDTGYIRKQDMELIKDANIYIFESNHDPEMLMLTARPYHIKQRILSDEGHLSNEDAALILSQVVTDNTKEVVLAHLSLQANSEDLAISTMRKHLNSDSIIVKAARQFEVVFGG